MMRKFLRNNHHTLRHAGNSVFFHSARLLSTEAETSAYALPLGIDNFRIAIEDGLDIVDKSLFIKEVLDDRATEVCVITCPRCFAKTFNLSMLHHFLAPEDALNQIVNHQYDEELQQGGIPQAHQIGIGFRGKKCAVAISAVEYDHQPDATPN